MTTMNTTANGKAIDAGVGEKLSITQEVEAHCNDHGAFTARPPHYQVKVHRTMPREAGTLKLMQVAVASQRFNLLAAQQDKHPKGTFVEQTRRGRKTIDLYRLEIADFQADEWSFSWIGEGNDGLTGCTVAEELVLIASAGVVVNLADSGKAPFDLRQ